MSGMVQLTERLRVNNGSHILYFYDELEEYLNNAVSFIRTGLELGQHIIIVENRSRMEVILYRLKPFISEEQFERLNLIDSYQFYEAHESFNYNLVFQNLVVVVQPYLDGAIPVRAWAHVALNDEGFVLENLSTYECRCDLAINQLGILTVCSYSAQTLSATVLIKMMKYHEYVMMDQEIVRSNLYSRQDEAILFPSLAEHESIKSEIDLYKQKLDFVHVVSHEVRNPLTVIKAYASILLDEDLSQESKKKLVVIKDYVSVIDNEISHIINTEQMLTSEGFWMKSAVSPLPPIKEVIDIMKIKARTQGIELQTTISVTGSEVINSNIMGLRLIISNLLSNAIKFSDDGNVVVLKVISKMEAITIQIKDFGLGMPSDQIPKLFRKYQKMSAEKEGQGIGLFMVKKLVDHFDGEICIESEVGFGTEVFVKLPLINKTIHK